MLAEVISKSKHPSTLDRINYLNIELTLLKISILIFMYESKYIEIKPPKNSNLVDIE